MASHPHHPSELNRKVYGHIEQWRNRPIEGEHPCVHLDGICLKRSSALVAIGVSAEGYREVPGVTEGPGRKTVRRAGLPASPQAAGPKGVRLFTKVKPVAAMLKAIHAQEDRLAAREKVNRWRRISRRPILA